VRRYGSFRSILKKKRLSAGCFVDGPAAHYVLHDHTQPDGRMQVVCDFRIDLRACKGTVFDPSDVCVNHRALFERFAEMGIAKKIPIRFALPSRLCAFRTIRADGMTIEEARSAVRYSFARYFSFAESEAAYDLSETIVPCAEGHIPAFLLAASRRRFVEALTQACETHGYEVAAVEPADASIERFCRIQTLEEACALFLFVGRDATIFLSDRGRAFFYRTFEVAESGIGLLGELKNNDAALNGMLESVLAQYPDFSPVRVHLFAIDGISELDAGLRLFFPHIEVLAHPLKMLCGSFDGNTACLPDRIIAAGAALWTL